MHRLLIGKLNLDSRVGLIVVLYSHLCWPPGEVCCCWGRRGGGVGGSGLLRRILTKGLRWE